MFCVYVLFDKRMPEEVRYVGLSAKVVARVAEHIAEARKSQRDTRKLRWIRSLFVDEETPGWDVVGCYATAIEVAAAERQAIAKYRAAGHRITNGTYGGDGATTWSRRETRERQRQNMLVFHASTAGSLTRQRARECALRQQADPSYTGGFRSDSARAKMRLAKLGKPGLPKTPEWKAKISAAQKGKPRGPWSEERKAAHRARLNDPETKARMRASALARSA